MAAEKRLRIVPTNWTYQEFLEFVTAARSGNSQAQYELAVKVIVSWPYEVDLGSKEPMMELGVAESANVLRAVFDMMNTMAEEGDTSAVQVDFTPWNTRRFLEFDSARSEGKWMKVERMMHEVAKLEGTSPNKPLNAEQGATMLKAISDAYTKIIQGKN